MRCQAVHLRDSRSAFTLVEMLVVIALIVIIAALGIFAIPLFQTQQQATQNASQIVAWLGDAKVQALRQQRATGLRFVPDPNAPNFLREVYYVQTPDDFRGGMGDPAGGRLYQPNPKTLDEHSLFASRFLGRAGGGGSTGLAGATRRLPGNQRRRSAVSDYRRPQFAILDRVARRECRGRHL